MITVWRFFDTFSKNCSQDIAIDEEGYVSLWCVFTKYIEKMKTVLSEKWIFENE